VYHLAEEIYALAGVFLDSAVADLNRILYTIAKTEMPGENKLNRAEVQDGGGEILLSRIL